MEVIQFIFFFLLATVISFVGSLQVGPVNLGVMHASINKGYKPALWMGLGGSLPELIYSAGAFWFSDILQNYPQLIKGVNFIVTPALILIGIYLLVKKTTFRKPVEGNKKLTFPFLTGFILGSLNPMLLPFWVLIIEYLKNVGLNVHDQSVYEYGFIVGTAFGAFLLQYVIATLIRRQKEKFEKKFMRYANPVIGVIIILVGLVQLIKLFN